MTNTTTPSAFEPSADRADTPAAAAGGAAAASAASAGSGKSAASASTGRQSPPGWIETLQSIWRELPGLVGDRVELLSLEVQRAGRTLAQIVALLVAAAILGVTAWLALWAGIAVGLVELGLHWALSLLLVLALNAGVAWLAIVRLRLLLPLLGLPATRRHLTPGCTAESRLPAVAPPDAEAAAAPLGSAN